MGTPRGKKLSEEHKKKISKALKGRMPKNIEILKKCHKKGGIPWNKGRKETRLDVLKKQSYSHIGQVAWNKGLTIGDNRVKKYAHKKGEFKHSQQTKEKIQRVNKGKRFSPNTEFKKGQIAPMKGRKLSPERCKKISNYMKGRFFGEKSPRWKGGVSKVNKLIRCMPEYKQWRSDIFQRDNWTCQTCQKRGCYLEPHHKYKLSSLIKENNIKTIIDARNCLSIWDVNNGVTLCVECHMLADKHRRNFK